MRGSPHSSDQTVQGHIRMGAELHFQRSRWQLSTSLPWNNPYSYSTCSDIMTAIKLNEPVKAILLDIEGTTTPIDFVYQTLFPYAREHASLYIEQHLSDTDVKIDLAGLRIENAADLAKGLNPPSLQAKETGLDTIVAYIHWLMDRDRKSASLKSLQGKIWEVGYNSGTLKSEVFDDVPRALERWRKQNRRVSVYSSGSILAQKLLFAHTSAGDLTGLIDSYFDITIGGKREVESYRQIAESLQLLPAE